MHARTHARTHALKPSAHAQWRTCKSLSRMVFHGGMYPSGSATDPDDNWIKAYGIERDDTIKVSVLCVLACVHGT